MDRSLDDVILERQRARPRGGTGRSRGGRYDDRSRDIARKPPTREDPRELDKDDWVHDRYEGDRFNDRETRHPQDRKIDRVDRYEIRNEGPYEAPAKLRVDNLHYDLTETDLRELFTRIGPIKTISILYDRSDRSRGTAFVTYTSQRDAHRAIREFDGANAYGQPIKLALMPSGPGGGGQSISAGRGGAGLSARLDSAPVRSLFDRIENGRGAGGSTMRRGRSESPIRDRRSEVLREEVPEGIDRYIPGAGARNARSRSPLPARRRGRGGAKREDTSRGTGRDRDSRLTVQGRPRKTAKELDAEMDNYWDGTGPDASGNVGMADAEGSGGHGATDFSAVVVDEDIDMIE